MGGVSLSGSILTHVEVSRLYLWIIPVDIYLLSVRIVPLTWPIFPIFPYISFKLRLLLLESLLLLIIYGLLKMRPIFPMYSLFYILNIWMFVLIFYSHKYCAKNNVASYLVRQNNIARLFLSIFAHNIKLSFV